MARPYQTENYGLHLASPLDGDVGPDGYYYWVENLNALAVDAALDSLQQQISAVTGSASGFLDGGTF